MACLKLDGVMISDKKQRQKKEEKKKKRQEPAVRTDPTFFNLGLRLFFVFLQEGRSAKLLFLFGGGLAGRLVTLLVAGVSGFLPLGCVGSGGGGVFGRKRWSI